MVNTIKKYLFLLLLISLTFTSTALPTYAADTPIVTGLNCYNANGWSASKIIYYSAQWYGLNPYAILATLQKEQSLVTTSTLNQYGLDWAMGYGVPDSGDRDYSRQGFATQVDWGTWQLAWNMNNANSSDATLRAKVSPYITGNTITIDGVSTHLDNGATASLYRYTPHFHGNQNFRNIMNLWTDPDVAWDSTNIIADSIFANKNTMTQQQIQDFLVAKNSYLKGYVETRNVAIGPDSYKCPIIKTNVYRFYNFKNGSHFYTASELEKYNVATKLTSSYRYEGISYPLNYSSGRNTAPLYRFYNLKNSSHFYTASLVERNNIIAKLSSTYRYEGTAWYVSKVSTASFPVYRFYNVKNGTHFYTASAAEKANVIAKLSATYRYEGVAYYIPY